MRPKSAFVRLEGMHIVTNWGVRIDINSAEERTLAAKDPYCAIPVPVYNDAGDFLPFEFINGEVVPERSEVNEDGSHYPCD